MMHRTDVAIVLINNTQVGGAERRFARVWTGLRRRSRSATLIVNRSLFRRLVRAGVLSHADAPVVVMPEPFGALACLVFGEIETRTGVVARLGFWLGKLDYVLGSWAMAWWLLIHRPRLIHAVLGGAYVVWPSQMLGLAPPTLLSMVCPSLRGMAGTGLGERLYRRALKRAAVVDALTDSIRDELIRSDTPADRIRVSSGSFVDTHRYRSREHKEPWVAFTGRLVEEKNPMLFVEACALIRRRLHGRLPRLRFFVVGDGPLRGEIDGAVARLGLSSCLETGWRDDVESVLGAAQVFVSLQRTDNYPSQALLEAMACECAVVATDVGQTNRLVDDRVGLRVESRAAAVADAVCRILEEPARARGMGRQGRRLVVESHSTDAYLDYVESVYAAAIGGSPVTTKTGAFASGFTSHVSRS
jgi:glycosyltransferase involved in cell wall biosynthesis